MEMDASTICANPPIDETKSKKSKKRKNNPGDASSTAPAPKRTKSPGVRVIGGRIYDSDNGKTCHQCRQKTMDFVAACKVLKNDKPCTLKFCHKCLSNRYGEKAEVVQQSQDWECPKCRGICNCSFCMKKRGYQPTGILAHTAKATGFSSVSEMLQVNPTANITAASEEDPSGASTPSNGSMKRKKSKKSKGISEGGQDDGVQSEKRTKKVKKSNEGRINGSDDGGQENRFKTESDLDIPLPLGIHLTAVAGIDVAIEDSGNALQFMEFCKTFGEILDLKQGQAESVLEELTKGRSHDRRKKSSLIYFHIQLLSFIRKDAGQESPLSPTSSGNSWLQALEKCISESRCALTDFPLDFFYLGDDGYEKLDPSKKLRLLNFLCDETLCTASMRDYIDKQNLKRVKKEKVAKEKVLAAKDKERQAKQKMQDEVAKAVLLKNGAPLTISEHEDLVSQIKAEVAKAHAERLEAMEMVPKKKQRSDTVRTEPVYMDGDGHLFWKLKGYSAEPDILHQEVRCLDSDKPEDKWSTFNLEQKTTVENYISSVRKKRCELQVYPDTVQGENREEDAGRDPDSLAGEEMEAIIALDALAMGESEAIVEHKPSEDVSSQFVKD